jgi:hypothetical protein
MIIISWKQFHSIDMRMYSTYIGWGILSAGKCAIWIGGQCTQVAATACVNFFKAIDVDPWPLRERRLFVRSAFWHRWKASRAVFTNSVLPTLDGLHSSPPSQTTHSYLHPREGNPRGRTDGRRRRDESPGMGRRFHPRRSYLARHDDDPSHR